MVSNDDEFVICLLETLVNLAAPIEFSIKPEFEAGHTFLAQYRSTSDIFQAVVQPILAQNRLLHLLKVAFHLSLWLLSPEDALEAHQDLSGRTAKVSKA